MSDILIKNPLVLHFSGHGIKNDKEHLGAEAAIYQGEGDMLLFEDNKCCGVFRSEKNISKILEKCKTDIKVVVMLSCHSERVGKIFYNAGIKHVIWIKESEKIADRACIVFANAFYKKLFSTNSSSIWEAFNYAKAAVGFQSVPGENGYGVGEDSKFIMFPNPQWK